MKGTDSLVEGLGRELELPGGDGVDSVERDSDHLLTLEVDEVVLAYQEGPICEEHQALFLVVPVVYSVWKERREIVSQQKIKK